MDEVGARDLCSEVGRDGTHDEVHDGEHDGAGHGGDPRILEKFTTPQSLAGQRAAPQRDLPDHPSSIPEAS
jgi:hypothetical protein